MEAGVANDGASRSTHSTLVMMSLGLTEKGLWEGGGEGGEVVRAVWGYLRMMRTEGVQEWVWREMAKLAVRVWGVGGLAAACCVGWWVCLVQPGDYAMVSAR